MVSIPSYARRTSFASLLSEVRQCTICAAHLPHGCRPVLQVHSDARILIVGQAPGRKVHESGQPFTDASGDRLRDWLGVDPETFYDPTRFAIVPMGFCFPGTAKGGDLPPRQECAPAWREQVLGELRDVRLTVVIGKYAMDYHLQGPTRSVTEAVQAWRGSWPLVVPVPHPSPRNVRWFANNPWFTQELIPELQTRVVQVLAP